MKLKPSLQKHPAGTAGARPHWFSSCGHVSTGTPGKENKGTGLKTRQWGTSFLMSSVFCLKALCHMALWLQIFEHLAVTLSNFAFLSPGVEAGHPVRSVRDADDHPGCHLPQHQEKSRLADGEDARERLHRLCSGIIFCTVVVFFPPLFWKLAHRILSW